MASKSAVERAVARFLREYCEGCDLIEECAQTPRSHGILPGSVLTCCWHRQNTGTTVPALRRAVLAARKAKGKKGGAK